MQTYMYICCYPKNNLHRKSKANRLVFGPHDVLLYFC